MRYVTAGSFGLFLGGGLSIGLLMLLGLLSETGWIRPQSIKGAWLLTGIIANLFLVKVPSLIRSRGENVSFFISAILCHLGIYTLMVYHVALFVY